MHHSIRLISLTILSVLLANLPVPKASATPFPKDPITPSPRTFAQISTSDRKAEADRLYQQGFEQFDTSQYQAALESLQTALKLYQAIGR